MAREEREGSVFFRGHRYITGPRHYLTSSLRVVGRGMGDRYRSGIMGIWGLHVLGVYGGVCGWVTQVVCEMEQREVSWRWAVIASRRAGARNLTEKKGDCFSLLLWQRFLLRSLLLCHRRQARNLCQVSLVQSTYCIYCILYRLYRVLPARPS